MTEQTKRILSVDVFRGLTIALMILVNAQGSRNPYPLLDHAPWNGGTLADIVFPFFLFIVGLTSVIVLQRQRREVEKSTLYVNILKRSLILFVLGILLNFLPFHIDFASFRFYGILQRIALCYCLVAIIYLNTSVKAQFLIFLGILWAYWFIMTQIPVPGFGANQLRANSTWVAYVDQWVFQSSHLFFKVYDPEGLLSTLPSVASTLLGLLTGSFLLSPVPKVRKFILMFGAGLLCLCIACLWNPNFPINKNIWTSSFVLWSGGYALITFSFCFLIIDILGYQQWSLPLKIFGMNALFIFCFHVFLLKVQGVYQFTLSNGQVDNLRVATTDYLFGGFSPQNAGLLYAIAFVFLNFLVALFLYKRKIFIRI